MLRLLTTIIGLPVVSQRQGAPVAAIRATVCDPAAGKVIAYRVDTAPGFLATADILTYLDEGLVVTDREVIQSEDDLVRVKRLGADRTALIGLKAVDEHGRRVGTVSDVLLETEGHFVTKLHIRPGLFKRLFVSERIIPRERVIKMTAREVTVRYDNEARPVGAEPEIAQ